jgi:dTMP kinase
MTGLFVSFEGGEGSGKSTQIGRLADWLCETWPQIELVRTREPGGTQQSEQIRALLVNGQADKYTARTEALLMVAARTELVSQIIRPALQRGAIVLCDRFRDSTSVYQGLAHDIDQADIDRLHQFAIGDLKPDMTFLLDLPAEEGLARAGQRGAAESRFEEKGLAFHSRVRDGYRQLAEANKDRFVVLDASQPEDKLAAEIRQHLSVLIDQFVHKERDLQKNPGTGD